MKYQQDRKCSEVFEPRAEITATGVYLPENIVTSVELMKEINSEKLYGIPNDWIDVNTGILERRISDPNMRPSDLAIKAAIAAIADKNQGCIRNIEMVLFCGIERDQPEPATAHVVANALGIKAKLAFDVANACFGFIDGLQIASRFIQSNAIRSALVVTGEIPSRVMMAAVSHLKTGVSQSQLMTKIGALTVGDAGGAILLRSNRDAGGSGFYRFANSCDSSQVDKCIYWKDEQGAINGSMHMAKVIAKGHSLLKRLDRDRKKELDRYDWLICHQTSKASVEFAKRVVNISNSKIISTYPKLGNTATAAFPLSFAKLLELGKLKQGQKIACWFAGSGVTAGQFEYIY